MKRGELDQHEALSAPQLWIQADKRLPFRPPCSLLLPMMDMSQNTLHLYITFSRHVKRNKESSQCNMLCATMPSHMFLFDYIYYIIFKQYARKLTRGTKVCSHCAKCLQPCIATVIRAQSIIFLMLLAIRYYQNHQTKQNKCTKFLTLYSRQSIRGGR